MCFYKKKLRKHIVFFSLYKKLCVFNFKLFMIKTYFPIDNNILYIEMIFYLKYIKIYYFRIITQHIFYFS